MLKNPFTQHLKSVNEGYISHLIEAIYCGSLMLAAGLVCIIHAIFPFLFTKFASSKIVYIINRFERRYKKKFL